MATKGKRYPAEVRERAVRAGPAHRSPRRSPGHKLPQQREVGFRPQPRRVIVGRCTHRGYKPVDQHSRNRMGLLPGDSWQDPRSAKRTIPTAKRRTR